MMHSSEASQTLSTTRLPTSMMVFIAARAILGPGSGLHEHRALVRPRRLDTVVFSRKRGLARTQTLCLARGRCNRSPLPLGIRLTKLPVEYLTYRTRGLVGGWLR